MKRKHGWVRCRQFGYARKPDAPGVYVLFQGRKVIYVGSMTCLSARLASRRSHERGQHSTSIAYRQSTVVGDWLFDEIRLIRRLNPPLNLGGKKNARNPWRGGRALTMREADK